MSAPCPQPSGYVQVLCTTHNPLVPSASLAHTGVDVWPVVAIALLLIVVGVLVVSYRRLHSKDRQSTR